MTILIYRLAVIGCQANEKHNVTADAHQPDLTLDYCDLRCPNLLITIIKEVEKANPGQVLRILASDLNAPSSIGSWTRQSEHELLELYEEAGYFVFHILRQPIINDQRSTINDQQPITNY